MYDDIVVDEDLSDNGFSERKLVTVDDDGLSISSQYRRPGETEWNYWHDQGDRISLTGLEAAFSMIEKAVVAYRQEANRKGQTDA